MYGFSINIKHLHFYSGKGCDLNARQSRPFSGHGFNTGHLICYSEQDLSAVLFCLLFKGSEDSSSPIFGCFLNSPDLECFRILDIFDSD
jgi:hypothetical protein